MAAENRMDVFVTPARCCHCGGEISVRGCHGRLSVCRCQHCGKVVTVGPLRRPGRQGDVLDLHAEIQRDAVRPGDDRLGWAPRAMFLLTGLGLFVFFLFVTMLVAVTLWARLRGQGGE